MVWTLRAWAASTYGERTLGRPRTSRSSTTQGRDHAQHYVALLLQKAVRIGSFCYVQLMTLVILVYDLSRRSGRRESSFLRPSSAIAPVQSGRTFRCALRVERVDRAGAVCYSCVLFTSGKRKGVGGHPSASWEDRSRQSQEVSTLFAGMTRREVNRLAQGAPLTL